MKKLAISMLPLICGFLLAMPVNAQSLDSVFVNTDTLTYKGYTVSKSRGAEDPNHWSATLKRGETTLATFEKGWSDHMTKFGLFPFLGGEEKQFVIEQYSGGAHCCWSYWIINLSPTFEIIYEGTGYGGIKPLDLDKDGVFEFTRLIDSFDYFDRLSHVESPFPVVVFKYDKSRRTYFPANDLFPEYTLKGIDEDIEKVKELKESLDFTKCCDADKYLSALLEVFLKYVYALKEDEAWFFYNEAYDLPDREEMRSKIRKKLDQCALYKQIYGR